ncbi:hypothetical protein OIE68_45760 [Nocardia vinacea]|uniref:hypothetical protein n=1 Tax=Nocardia vinacea TaxID=96468 RepID=UPI002E14157D|nr:hypothetical protein OIE68_45760 [Nocardia vinacea]
MPVAIPVERVLARTEDVVAALVGARAYREGIELSLHLYVRPGSDHSALSGFHGYPSGAKDQFLVGVEFSDGRTATNIDLWRLDDDADNAILMSGGGGSSDGFSATTYYLTPLPPPGSLTVIVAWPAAGIAEQRVELDTEAFRQAAERTEVLWPADSDTKPRELPRVVPDFAPGGWFERALN